MNQQGLGGGDTCDLLDLVLVESVVGQTEKTLLVTSGMLWA